jgi:hypothetical protein
MMPVLPPTTLIWGFRWFNTLKVGSVVIFKHDNKEKIKRISEIKDGKLYLLGDHPDASTDSRSFGWIDTDAVVAKVIWPRVPKSMIEN